MAEPADTDPVPRVCAFVDKERRNRGATFEDIATRLGVGNSTAQRLCKGQEPKLDQLADLERWWGLPVGYFVRAAGYAGDVLTVEDAVHSDPSLSPSARDGLLAAYGAFVNQDRGRK